MCGGAAAGSSVAVVRAVCRRAACVGDGGVMVAGIRTNLARTPPPPEAPRGRVGAKSSLKSIDMPPRELLRKLMVLVALLQEASWT